LKRLPTKGTFECLQRTLGNSSGLENLMRVKSISK
jgi:hypothetical protein